MTISNTSERRAGPYATDGVDVEFPFEFKVFEAEDLVVTSSEDGTDTVLEFGSDYTVELNEDQEDDPGGTVTLVAAPDGPVVTIISGMDYTQPTVFTNSGGFYPRVLNNSLDRVTILIQQLKEKVSRALVAPFDTDAVAGQYVVVMPDGTYGYASGSGADSALREDLADDAADKGTNIIVHKPADADAVQRSVARVIDDGGLYLHNFGDGVGQGTSAVDTLAWEKFVYAALTSNRRRLIVPPGDYLIENTIAPPANLNCVEVVGMGGYDGVRSVLNFGMRTSLKAVGTWDPADAIIQLDRASGWVWGGVSLNCNYLAGYGLQLMSNDTTTGSAKNIIERSTICYALRDGTIVGKDGNPAVDPGDRQFYANRFIDLTFFGCARSGIHINEWNADQQIFDSCSFYYDDAVSPQDTLNAFWFDHGGQQSLLINCQAGGMTVVGGNASSGFMIKNKADDSSPYATTGGAIGLHVVNCWQEGDGGLYYAVTGQNDHKSFLFQRCSSFTDDPANRSVFIDKGTSAQVPYTFDSCTFLSDIEINSATMNRESFKLINPSFASGKGVIDNNDVLVVDRTVTKVGTTGASYAISRYADVLLLTLSENIATLYTEGVTEKGHILTLFVTQGASAFTIAWAGSTNFYSVPAIPDPNGTAGAVTVYTFVSDGSKYRLSSVQGN